MKKVPVALFTAMDLDDALGPGGDLWQYSYAVSGFPFPKDCRYSLSCACGLHSNRENPPAVVDADWDDLIIQPAPSSPRCGSLRCPGSGAGAGDPEWLVKPGA